VSRVLAPALAIVILALLLATPHVDAQAQGQVEVRIRWVTYINPTDGEDSASGACIFGDYIAVVGAAGSKPYVALLRKSDGVVIREWIGRENGAFLNCISIGGKLYAIGHTTVDIVNDYGVIYVFDVNLKVLARVRSESPSEYYSLAYDGKALYLGGWIYEDVDGDGKQEIVGLVEKRALDESLSLVNSKKIYFGSWEWGWINDIGVEPSTGRIWAVGFYEDSNIEEHSLIVIFDSDLREFKVIDYPKDNVRFLGWLTGIAFDGRYVYISSLGGVAKFTADGRLVTINRDGKAREKIVYGYNYLYTFGGNYTKGYYRYMLYIHDTNLNLVKSYVLSENVNVNSYFLVSYVGRPVLEGNNIYVAGIDYALGYSDFRIVVYSLLIEGVMVTTATGVEGVVATIATTTPAYTTTPTTTTPSDTILTIAFLIVLGGMLAILFLLFESSRGLVGVGGRYSVKCLNYRSVVFGFPRSSTSLRKLRKG